MLPECTCPTRTSFPLRDEVINWCFISNACKDDNDHCSAGCGGRPEGKHIPFITLSPSPVAKNGYGVVVGWAGQIVELFGACNEKQLRGTKE